MDPTLTVIERVAEYDGAPVVAIAATQLGLPAAQAARVLDDWIEFFSAGTSGIAELEFRSRTPARLFAALAAQTQLRRLELKWGDYADLSVLSGMTQLDTLMLGGAVGVTSLAPLTALGSLRRLVLTGTRRVADYAPLGRMSWLRELIVVDDFTGPRLHARSVEFVRGMTGLTSLRWSPIVDSADYSPFLALTNVDDLWITASRGMSPRMDELEAALPALNQRYG